MLHSRMTPATSSWLLLALAFLGALLTASALVPGRHLGWGNVLYFLASAPVHELPLVHIGVSGAIAVALVAWGALSAWPGWLGLALVAASWAGLIIVHRRALPSRRVLREALETGLGPDFPERIPAQRRAAGDELTLCERYWPPGPRRASIERLRNIAYAPGHDRFRLDIYRARGSRANHAPVILQIPGGGWVTSGKNHQALPLMCYLVSQGWIAVAANYRLSPASRFPEALIDCKRALAWVRGNIARYGGDPGFVAITGGSSGAHLASLVALTSNDRRLQPGFETIDTSVAACVPFYGVYDFLDRQGLRHDRGVMTAWLAKTVMPCAPDADPSLWDLASPIACARPDAPPFFVLHGAHDSLAKVEEARAFVARLRAVSRSPVVYAELPGAQHAWDMVHSVRTAYTVRAVGQFLEWVGAAPMPVARQRAWRIRSWEVASSVRFQDGLAALAQAIGRGEAEVDREARGYLRELRTGHVPFIYRLIVRAGRALCASGYSRIDYDPAQVERLRTLLAREPCAVLSSHKSYLDGGALTVGFHDQGLPALTVFAGLNMAFWPIGAIWRRANAVFIRRSAPNPVYAWVLRQYLGSLAERRVPMQWFIEGTRSRTGKLGRPKLGLLVYLAEAYREKRIEDLRLVPAAIVYDELREVEEYAEETRGATKKPETLGWLVKFVREQRGRYGMIYVRFGEPVSLRAMLGSPERLPASESAVAREALQRVAREVCRRIAAATPITGTSLVTVALLGAHGHALTPAQIRVAVQGYLRHARSRGFPLTASAQLDDEARVEAVLEALRSHGIVDRIADGGRARYSIRPERHLRAAYYRNAIVHFFLDGAIVEVALLQAADAAPPERETAFWSAVRALRELLELEFFFGDENELRTALASDLDSLAPDWRAALARGPEGVRDLLGRIPVIASDMMLRAIFEAYSVIGQCLAREPDEVALDEASLEAHCLTLGRERLLQRQLRNPESVAKPLFRTGIELVRRRGLLESADGANARRREFAQTLGDALARMDTVHRIAAARVESLLASPSVPVGVGFTADLDRK